MLQISANSAFACAVLRNLQGFLHLIDLICCAHEMQTLRPLYGPFLLLFYAVLPDKYPFEGYLFGFGMSFFVVQWLCCAYSCLLQHVFWQQFALVFCIFCNTQTAQL